MLYPSSVYVDFSVNLDVERRSASVTEVFASQDQGPDFRAPESSQKAGHGSSCGPLLMYGLGRQVPRGHWSAMLTKLMRFGFSEKTLFETLKVKRA